MRSLSLLQLRFVAVEISGRPSLHGDYTTRPPLVRRGAEQRFGSLTERKEPSMVRYEPNLLR